VRITIYTLWEMEGATIYIGGIDCNTRREVVDYRTRARKPMPILPALAVG
jgi:hypothetical protein